MNRHQFARTNICFFKQKDFVDYFDPILHGPRQKFKRIFFCQNQYKMTALISIYIILISFKC